MKFSNLLFTSACPIALLALSVMPAMAQSTGTQEVETVTVTGVRLIETGLLTQETIAKARSTITNDYITSQGPGQTVFQALNMVPGVSFTNNDPYGASGGNVRIRGFDNARISLTWDGMPLNDTGNYAIYTNQMPDPVIVAKETVNLGTTDVDSPTASATGGTISLSTITPTDKFYTGVEASGGSFDYQRYQAVVNTGNFGPGNRTSAFLEYSYQHYGNWKGLDDTGYEQQKQLNIIVNEDLGNGDFIKVATHFNQNRNVYPASIPFTQFVKPTAANTGWDVNFDPSCTPVHSSPRNDTNDTCNNYYKYYINPSDTGNIRISSRFHLADNLILTVDPNVQYTLATGAGSSLNGGGVTWIMPENDPRLIGKSGGFGVDLSGGQNGVCASAAACLDKVRVQGSNITSTRRWGVLASLIWRPTDEHLIQVGYTLDYGLHIQTGQFAYFDSNNNPQNPFAGAGNDHQYAIHTLDGGYLQTRNRRSEAILNQVSFDYEGRYLSDMVRVTLGGRLPFFRRDLNQNCYQSITNSFNPGTSGGQYCTAEASSAVAANNTVTFTGVSGTFIPPVSTVKHYSRFLPNAGVSVFPWGEEHEFYIAYAQTLGAPSTDNLYNATYNSTAGKWSAINISAKPETAQTFDLGYRFNTDNMNASITGWRTIFKNRLVSSYDPTTTTTIYHNVGTVNMAGVGFPGSFFPVKGVWVTLSSSYTHTRVVNDLPGSGYVVPIAGKELVETPDWEYSGRVQYSLFGFDLGLQGHFTGRRFATDLNDLKTGSYFITDFDIRYDLGQFLNQYGVGKTYLQVNGTNLFNQHYLGSISSKFCYTAAQTGKAYVGGCGAPTFNVGPVQTFMVTLHAEL
jgi:iron complex outermembrane recepter protein